MFISTCTIIGAVDGVEELVITIKIGSMLALSKILELFLIFYNLDFNINYLDNCCCF
ncbi:hypothetical protein SAMN04488101_11813 [Pedobacter nyackensis]|uniref:Uncharacterized protein n=1 Tax=Pedobacter nyackensis TaxID=475255 RepID=A0A1W2EZH8_9SPHI|nr:hypothetical protein SAMN04488101_11813 [Pedobacter nyackensis]